ncbi:SMP-30/gluconolactonase/LRE family protein [Actinomadura formosensis]|uniref:SMP-30/gluconolactonase/LRE family protein n=1 Tax=Actinomadura formosensis TaxID=60706 RepID=UPI001A956012|nr:SMP-30/gluconolactonase/LRE family protein [Actinomadura formosensis]
MTEHLRASAAADMPGLAAYVLPGDRVYPEGIAADPRTGTLYAGSFQDGTVYRMRPGHRAAEVFLPAGADGRRTANGLKVDGAGRLWVTDSSAGVSVYDTGSRRLLARFVVPGTGARFVNDLAIARDGGAYLTDSLRSVVYRVTPRDLAGARGGPATLAVGFDLGDALEPHGPGDFTLNGIVAAPTGRFLLTDDMLGGDLYRLDLATGAVREVALQGGDMRNADGLELQHGRLWTAHNLDNVIRRWRVARDGTRVRLERSLADASLQVPTTLVRRRGTLYVVRSQFDKGGPLGDGTPEIPFTIAAVRGI